MNYRMVRYILAHVLRLEGALMLLSCLIALIFREREGWVYLCVALASLLVGQLGAKKPVNMEIYQKEGFVSVGLSWVLLSIVGAIPFVVTGEIPFYIDSLFEIVSGFTTTGSSILSNVEALSHTSLFWRSFSHWTGGMGVLVFVLMMIPASGGSHMNLMKAESPGPDVSKFVPRVRQTAILLYKIYIVMTVVEIAVLLLSGMHWFDSLCISFGTAGTGGFTVLNSGMASYTPAQHWIVGVFMVLFGVNFTFYYMILCKRTGEALRMEEVRAYLGIILAATILTAAGIHRQFDSAEAVFRHAFFQVGSIMTTTGYATADFDLWPAFAKTILLLLMFIGACAGSTGGGIKVSRVVMMIKAVKREFRQMIHPRSIGKVRINGQSVSTELLRTVLTFLTAYVILYALSVFLISINGFSLETNASAVAATLNNIGPGFDRVGPMANYDLFSPFSKIVLIFDMLAGRLELFPLLILFHPVLWKEVIAQKKKSRTWYRGSDR